MKEEDTETRRRGDTEILRVTVSPLPRVYLCPGAGFLGNFSSRIAVL